MSKVAIWLLIAAVVSVFLAGISKATDGLFIGLAVVCGLAGIVLMFAAYAQ